MTWANKCRTSRESVEYWDVAATTASCHIIHSISNPDERPINSACSIQHLPLNVCTALNMLIHANNKNKSWYVIFTSLTSSSTHTEVERLQRNSAQAAASGACVGCCMHRLCSCATEIEPLGIAPTSTWVS